MVPQFLVWQGRAGQGREGQTYRQAGRQAGRWAGRQTERQRDRETFCFQARQSPRSAGLAWLHVAAQHAQQVWPILPSTQPMPSQGGGPALCSARHAQSSGHRCCRVAATFHGKRAIPSARTSSTNDLAARQSTLKRRTLRTWALKISK